MARERGARRRPAETPSSPVPEDAARPVWRDVTALGAAHLVLALLLFDPLPFTGGDNYWYMILAEGLRSGEGYRDFWLPGAPLHVRFPPVYPAILAVLGLVSPSVAFLKLASAVFTTGAVAFTYLVARRLSSRRVALAAAALLACSPIVVEYSHWVLSEPTFLFLVTVSLLGLARYDDDPSWGALVLGIAAATAAALTRSAGYPLIAAGALYLALRRRWAAAGLAVVIPLLGLGWWSWVKSTGTSTDIPYSQWLLFRNPYDPGLGQVSVADMVRRVWHNLTLYPFTVLPHSVAGRDVPAGAGWILGGILTGLALFGTWRGRARMGLLVLFMALYTGLLLVWPEAWSDQRFLLPALPVVLVLAFTGLDEVGRALGSGRGASHWTWTLGTSGLLLVAVLGNVRIAPPQVECTLRYVRGEEMACSAPPVTDFIRLAEWARENTPEGAVVANRKPQVFHWYGRRAGDTYAFSDDPGAVLASLDSMGASFVVVDTWFGTTGRYLIPAIQAHPDRFELMHAVGSPQTVLLRYNPTPGTEP